MNDRVLQQLNLLLATPDGRAYLDASLVRMRDHQAMIEDRLAQAGLPPELLAVPLTKTQVLDLACIEVLSPDCLDYYFPGQTRMATEEEFTHPPLAKLTDYLVIPDGASEHIIHDCDE